MKITGIVLMVIGGLILVSAFGYDTAPEGTHNIGLLQKQMMTFQLGGIGVLLGALFTAAGLIVSRLQSAGILPPAGVKMPAIPKLGQGEGE